MSVSNLTSSLGQKVVTDITANDGIWTFLCVTWSSFDGLWVIYVNGKVIDHGDKLSEGQEISSDGVLVVGQEQDSPGGKVQSNLQKICEIIFHGKN